MSLTLSSTISSSSEKSGASVAELCDRNLATAASVYALAATGGATIAVGFVVIPEVAIIGCATAFGLATYGQRQHQAHLKDKLDETLAPYRAKVDEKAAESSKDEVVS